MTSPASSSTIELPDLPGGPYDLEFFFDPGCPFAWQTSVWIRRVVELRGVRVGWRFISLTFLNEGREEPVPGMREAHERGLAFHRICAAARAAFGNEAVGDLYRSWGDAFWYEERPGEGLEKVVEAFAATDPAAVVASVGLPESLLAAADDDSWDGLIRAETTEALRRTGDDVGTPIITFDPPTGNSLFGPVISSVPDDETCLAFYDALRTFVDVQEFSELKRSARAPLDLPLLQ